MAEHADANLEINIVPPATPGSPSSVQLKGPAGLLINLPLQVATHMGVTLVQVAAVASERDRLGTHVTAPPAPPLIVI